MSYYTAASWKCLCLLQLQLLLFICTAAWETGKCLLCFTSSPLSPTTCPGLLSEFEKLKLQLGISYVIFLFKCFKRLNVLSSFTALSSREKLVCHLRVLRIPRKCKSFKGGPQDAKYWDQVAKFYMLEHCQILQNRNIQYLRELFPVVPSLLVKHYNFP